MGPENRRVRVLVVDDSAVMRKLVSNLLDRDEDIEVVGTAIDGDFALNKVEQLKPDVVTLDVDMPRMDGISALGQIVSKHSTPVVMLSSLTTRGASLTMRALDAGASDFVCKPRASTQVGEMAEELITKIKAAARYKVAAQPVAAPVVAPVVAPVASGGGVWDRPQAKPARRTQGSGKIIAIGASSGGPHALRYLLPRLPADLDAGVVIVQHMPESFTAMLARWLDDICALEVKEAKQGDLIAPGKVLIAPGNLHLKVKRRPLGGEVMLEGGPLVSGHIPSVDVLFRSVAAEYGGDATGVIMTGMGSDGAAGIGEMKRAGGYTMAQDEESCAIYGMPRVAIERGFIDKVVPLTEMALHLVSAVGQSKLIGESHVG